MAYNSSMGEAIGEQYPENTDELSRMQYASPSWVLTRWNLYRLAKNPVDFYEMAYEKLELAGDETVLDIGCADGSGLVDLRSHRQHDGRLIGIDINDIIFSSAKTKVRDQSLKDIEFMVANAQELPLADNTVDISMALFMLYHVPDRDTALDEMRRVTKPGGRVAVATSGKANKPRHRQFERDIAAYLGVAEPPIFARPFDYDVAAWALPKKFDIIEHFEYRDEMHITDDEYDAYLDSLASMKDAFSPRPSYRKFVEAADMVVRPTIFEEIDEKGYFSDSIDRHLFICQNRLK